MFQNKKRNIIFKGVIYILCAMWTSLYNAEAYPMQQNIDHERFMRQAIREARLSKNLPIGAVIVVASTGNILAAEANGAHLDPTLHAEIAAIQKAARSKNVSWKDLILYSTAEPCPMCQSAILWAGIPRVYYGSSMLFLKQQGLPQIDIRAVDVVSKTSFRNIEIHGGLLEKECNALLLGYL